MKKAGEVDLVISLGKHNEPVDAFGLRVHLPNENLSYVSTKFGKLVEGWDFVGAHPKQNLLTIGGFDPVRSIETGVGGQIATIKFKVKDFSALKAIVKKDMFYDLVDDIAEFQINVIH